MSVCLFIYLFMYLFVCLFVYSSILQLEPLVNGPFTPDLANPISKLGQNAKENDWPTEIKVGKDRGRGRVLLIMSCHVTIMLSTDW